MLFKILKRLVDMIMNFLGQRMSHVGVLPLDCRAKRKFCRIFLVVIQVSGPMQLTDGSPTMGQKRARLITC